jgi:hypothetical protein
MCRCNCGRDLVNSALIALKTGTQNAFEEFFINGTTRVPNREHLRKLSPEVLSMLDKSIQSELIHSHSGGVSIDAVRMLIRSEGRFDVSRRTAAKAMERLGYVYCKLKRKVNFTSKRRKRIEDFILAYDTALESEGEKEAVIVYMDESYVDTFHKSQFGWDIKRELDHQINNCAVQQQVEGEERGIREGEKAGGKGRRHVFLCALTNDGIVCDPDEAIDKLRKQTYEPDLDHIDFSSTSSWIFQANKKGTKDYHDNMDSHMFITWVNKKYVTI